MSRDSGYPPMETSKPSGSMVELSQIMREFFHTSRRSIEPKAEIDFAFSRRFRVCRFDRSVAQIL